LQHPFLLLTAGDTLRQSEGHEFSDEDNCSPDAVLQPVHAEQKHDNLSTNVQGVSKK